MKTNFVKSILIMAMAAVSLTSCVNDDDYSVPALECNEPSMTNITLKTVQEIYDNATETATIYESADPNNPDVIEAVVVSSDKGGNFYKTLYLNNIVTVDGELHAGTIGFSVQINQADLFTDYGLGRKVYINLEGLYVQIRSNTLQIGALYNGNVGQIPALEYQDHITRSCTIIPEENLINVVTNLSDALSDNYIGRLISLEGVQFTDASLNQTYYNAGNLDAGGQTLTYITNSEQETVAMPFRTSSFADYAGTEVSPNSGRIIGILTKFSTTYQFVSRYEADLQLTEERIGGEPVEPGTPFFTEDFEDAVDNTDFNFPGWFNITESGSRKWSEQTYTPPGGTSNGYVEFSSFGSGSALNVAWLITPAMDFDANTNVTLQFQTAQHHLDVDNDGNKLEIFVITNFDGSDIAGATKVDVTGQVALPTSSTSWYEFVNSGAVNLSSYTGQVHIGFKFTGSGIDESLDGAFQIDNLVLSGN
ncbi:hypothetical protein E0W68_13105 [Flavobacterium salilacus subsp. salilacus]|uniref:DUF5689 domain-containing protein n=1 Tax=Flavobacterium TaxID=237 RepID=UPI0010753B9F|nr:MULTISPECIES: DUF5689 domain-containing protein [Flavobacterium]KAF2515074.1 hypothetical protein E0W68_13105 [Flavobacterium salilacus subsp. salilacus]MBE1615866.1 choice-of-anchor J domain-containing protein [Flavobacterium sp. SaA2.13]